MATLKAVAHKKKKNVYKNVFDRTSYKASCFILVMS